MSRDNPPRLRGPFASRLDKLQAIFRLRTSTYNNLHAKVRKAGGVPSYNTAVLKAKWRMQRAKRYYDREFAKYLPPERTPEELERLRDERIERLRLASVEASAAFDAIAQEASRTGDAARSEAYFEAEERAYMARDAWERAILNSRVM